ncbi:hypothetical protein GCM10025734_48020 [Kitasatospora paranensis]
MAALGERTAGDAAEEGRDGGDGGDQGEPAAQEAAPGMAGVGPRPGCSGGVPSGGAGGSGVPAGLSAEPWAWLSAYGCPGCTRGGCSGRYGSLLGYWSLMTTKLRLPDENLMRAGSEGSEKPVRFS